MKQNRNHDGWHVLYVDIDNTLVCRGQPNRMLIGKLIGLRETEESLIIVAWSARGVSHVEKVLNKLEVRNLFDLMLPKPTHFMDDMGRGFVNFMVDCTPANVRTRRNLTLHKN